MTARELVSVEVRIQRGSVPEAVTVRVLLDEVGDSGRDLVGGGTLPVEEEDTGVAIRFDSAEILDITRYEDVVVLPSVVEYLWVVGSEFQGVPDRLGDEPPLSEPGSDL